MAPSTSSVSAPPAPSSSGTVDGPSFVAAGTIDGKAIEISCHVFGDRMLDPATAIQWNTGRALVACNDEGFTITIELGNVAVGKSSLSDGRVQLAATSPLCGVSTKTPPTDFGGATGSVDILEWSSKTRRVRGAFKLAWNNGCGGTGGALNGSFAVVLAAKPPF